jgi:hypothetical protein
MPRQWHELTRDECVALLSRYGFQCYDHETLEELQEAVRANIEDGTIDLSELPD